MYKVNIVEIQYGCDVHIALAVGVRKIVLYWNTDVTRCFEIFDIIEVCTMSDFAT